MNPQQISTSFLIATGHIRAMRGGAQSHMLTANDGNAYVVKFANNPQSLRVLANEWLGCSIGRTIGLTIPEPAILYVPSQLVESSPSLVIQLSSSTLKCSHGMNLARVSFQRAKYSTTCPSRCFHESATRRSLPAHSLWTSASATVTVGKPCSAVQNQNGNSALISLTSATASTPESGISRTAHYAGSMRTESSIKTFLPIDTVVAQRCAVLNVPNPRSDRDALIAATALVHGMTVVSRNVSHFQPTGVGIVNPWQS